MSKVSKCKIKYKPFKIREDVAIGQVTDVSDLPHGLENLICTDPYN